MNKSRYIFLLICGIAMLAFIVPAYTHPGHQLVLDCRMKIMEEEVQYDLWIPIEILDELVSIQDGSGFVFNEEEQKIVDAKVEEYFKENNPISIDGIRVKPVVKEVYFIYQPPTFVAQVIMLFSLKTKPRQVSIIWDDLRIYDSLPIDQPQELSGVLLAEGEYRGIVFTKEEPEFIWHSLEGRKRAIRIETAETTPPPSYAPLTVALGIIAATPVIIALLMLLKIRRSVCWSTAALGILSILALYLFQVVYIPMHRPEFQMPTEAQAKEIFKTLHANIYRAFDYKTEDDIYDALAQSVGAGLLDEIYNEVYQSLILREAGGAVARIQSVKPIEIDMEEIKEPEDSEPAEFKVKCRWRVYGAVTHWGHTHARTNEYEAIYKAELKDAAWKIVAAETIEQIRLTPDIEGIDKEPVESISSENII